MESPEVVAAPLPTPVPSALPIPTQTFTNTNFAAPPHVYQTIQDGSIAVVYPPTPAPQYIQTPPVPVPAPVPEPQRQYEPEPTPSVSIVGSARGFYHIRYHRKRQKALFTGHHCIIATSMGLAKDCRRMFASLFP